MRTSVDSSTAKSKQDLLLSNQATFNETTAGGRPALLIHKLRLCTVMFDWYDDSSQKDQRAKEVKRQILLELVDYIGKNKNIYTEQVRRACHAISCCA
jgi:hypothetical protein